MMKRTALAALLVGLLVPCGTGALADSTINVTQPVQGLAYNAAPIRSNTDFAAATCTFPAWALSPSDDAMIMDVPTTKMAPTAIAIISSTNDCPDRESFI